MVTEDLETSEVVEAEDPILGLPETGTTAIRQDRTAIETLVHEDEAAGVAAAAHHVDVAIILLPMISARTETQA